MVPVGTEGTHLLEEGVAGVVFASVNQAQHVGVCEAVAVHEAGEAIILTHLACAHVFGHLESVLLDHLVG